MFGMLRFVLQTRVCPADVLIILFVLQTRVCPAEVLIILFVLQARVRDADARRHVGRGPAGAAAVPLLAQGRREHLQAHR